MTISQLYDILFDLRAAQSNCGALERAIYQARIVAVLAAIDLLAHK